MFGSLLILLVLPLTDLSRIRGAKFRPIMKLAFWFFVVDFAILMWIGAEHPATPYVEIGQFATAFYFAWFIIIVPSLGLIENSTLDIALDTKILNNNKPLTGGLTTYSQKFYFFLSAISLSLPSLASLDRQAGGGRNNHLIFFIYYH